MTPAVTSASRMMALIVASALLVAPALAQQADDMLGVPGPISFQEQDYVLSWTSRPNPDYIKQEYVPQGQTVETYSEMILIETVVGAITPIQAAALQVQSLDARKGTDPVVNHQIMQNEASGEVLLDFVVSDLSVDPVVVEWNAYRYAALPGSEGVMLFAVSRRGYGQDGATQFMSGLGALRSEAISALTAQPLPEISIAQ
ncbi:hypothetical protein ACFOOL_08080 [Devosia honganensis]|uniref:SRPBCC family protein n=1 Tax=Devosia honganensis TaxID=1610527 RepID=A0ABV7WZH8_9HYPH